MSSSSWVSAAITARLAAMIDLVRRRLFGAGAVPRSVRAAVQRILGAPVLLVGFGLPGENAHAPDEWMSVENFTKGMRAIATLWDELSQASGLPIPDPDLIAEARRIQVDVMPVAGEELQAMIASLYRTPKDLLEKARAAITGK